MTELQRKNYIELLEEKLKNEKNGNKAKWIINKIKRLRKGKRNDR